MARIQELKEFTEDEEECFSSAGPQHNPLKDQGRQNYQLSPNHIRCIWFLFSHTYVDLNLELVVFFTNTHYVRIILCMRHVLFYLILATLQIRYYYLYFIVD